MKHAEIVARLRKIIERATTDEELSACIRTDELSVLHAACSALSWREFKLPYDLDCVSVYTDVRCTALHTTRAVASIGTRWFEYAIPALKESQHDANI